MNNPASELSELPLQARTPYEWAKQVLKDPAKLLNDHAHLEKKAAANALQLIQRWPDHRPGETWSRELGSIARDEAQHLALVLKLLTQFGGSFTKWHRNPYAQGLRELVRHGRAEEDLLDRLLVSALIELRSCERFFLLAEAAEDEPLLKLYRGLWSSEKNHYLAFLRLAEEVSPRAAVNERWIWFLEREAEVIRKQSTDCALHSWVG